MPTYQFKCEECNSEISHLIPLNTSLNAPKCPDCKKDMIRVYGAISVAFRGSGWGSSKN